MGSIFVIPLRQKLISFNAINPPGNESLIAKFVRKYRSENGFNVEYPVFSKEKLRLDHRKITFYSTCVFTFWHQ